jgi:hypothetical protein
VKDYRALVIGVAALAACFLSDRAAAFHTGGEYTAHPFTRDLPGSAGTFYTGSPRSLGMDCTVCHTGAENYPQRISLSVETFRVQGSTLQSYALFTDGYVAQERYRIEVTIVGEHLGKELSNGSYENPTGSAHKIMCTIDASAESQLYNADNLSVEVTSDDGVYASYNGNASGGLRPDASESETDEGRCLDGAQNCGPNGGTHGEALTHTESGGPTTLAYRTWRLDPTINPPLGSYTCSTSCDAIVSNFWYLPWVDTPTNPTIRTFAFFWTAPATPPAAAGGRIRFYMAAVDGDGYLDTADDDVALKKLAVCPAGVPVSQCDRMIAGFDLN